MQKESKIRDPLILGNKTYHDITVDIAKPVETILVADSLTGQIAVNIAKEETNSGVP